MGQETCTGQHDETMAGLAGLAVWVFSFNMVLSATACVACLLNLQRCLPSLIRHFLSFA